MNWLLCNNHSFHAAPMLLHWFVCCFHSFHWYSILSVMLHSWYSIGFFAVVIPANSIPLVPSCFLPMVFDWFLHAALVVLIEPFTVIIPFIVIPLVPSCCTNTNGIPLVPLRYQLIQLVFQCCYHCFMQFQWCIPVCLL